MSITTIIFILSIAFSIGSIVYLLLSRPKKSKYVFVIDPGKQVSTHEIGHFLTAWALTTSYNIEARVHVNGKDGMAGSVIHDINNVLADEYIWNRLVVSIGGIAAETMMYGKFRSGPSEKDLEKSLKYARFIIKHKAYWVNKPGPAIDFLAVYKNITHEEAFIIRSAYNQAKEIIKSYGNRFYILVEQLDKYKVLSEQQAEKILGSRFPIKLVGNFKAKFVYPRSK